MDTFFDDEVIRLLSVKNVFYSNWDRNGTWFNEFLNKINRTIFLVKKTPKGHGKRAKTAIFLLLQHRKCWPSMKNSVCKIKSWKYHGYSKYKISIFKKVFITYENVGLFINVLKNSIF